MVDAHGYGVWPDWIPTPESVDGDKRIHKVPKIEANNSKKGFKGLVAK